MLKFMFVFVVDGALESFFNCLCAKIVSGQCKMTRASLSKRASNVKIGVVGNFDRSSYGSGYSL